MGAEARKWFLIAKAMQHFGAFKPEVFEQVADMVGHSGAMAKAISDRQLRRRIAIPQLKTRIEIGDA